MWREIHRNDLAIGITSANAVYNPVIARHRKLSVSILAIKRQMEKDVLITKIWWTLAHIRLRFNSDFWCTLWKFSHFLHSREGHRTELDQTLPRVQQGTILENGREKCRHLIATAKTWTPNWLFLIILWRHTCISANTFRKRNKHDIDKRRRDLNYQAPPPTLSPTLMNFGPQTSSERNVL